MICEQESNLRQAESENRGSCLTAGHLPVIIGTYHVQEVCMTSTLLPGTLQVFVEELKYL